MKRRALPLILGLSVLELHAGCAHSPNGQASLMLDQDRDVRMRWSERMAIPLTELPWPMQLNNSNVLHTKNALHSTALTCAQRSRELQEDIENTSAVAGRWQLATAITAGLVTSALGVGQLIKKDSVKTTATTSIGIGGGFLTTTFGAVSVFTNASDKLQQDSKMLSAINAGIRNLYTTWNTLLTKYSCDPDKSKAQQDSESNGPAVYDHFEDTVTEPGKVLHADDEKTRDLGLDWTIDGPHWTQKPRKRFADYLNDPAKRCQLGRKGQEALHLALLLEINKLSDICNGAPSRTDVSDERARP